MVSHAPLVNHLMPYINLGVDERGYRGLILCLESTREGRLTVAFLANKSPTERALAALPGTDVRICLSNGRDNPDELIARILRRETYFTAVLVASRGKHNNIPCGVTVSCGGTHGPHPFATCLSIATISGGACASCIYQSRARQCEHHE